MSRRLLGVLLAGLLVITGCSKSSDDEKTQGTRQYRSTYCEANAGDDQGDEDTPDPFFVNPRDGMRDVSIRTPIVVTFDDDMEFYSVEKSFSLTSASGQKVEVTAAWDDDESVVFTPVAPLAYDTTYTALIGEGAVSDDEDEESAEISCTFRTAKGEGVVEISAGWSHSIAVKADGTAYAWGFDSWGEMGNGPLLGSATLPVQILAPSGREGYMTGVVKAATGFCFTILLKDDGTIWTSGYNAYGGLGQGNYDMEGDGRFVQVKAPAGQEGYLTGIVDIAAGELNVVALKSDGTVYSWGDFGLLGNGTQEGSTLPVQVISAEGEGFLTGIVKVYSGQKHTLALSSDGTLYAWGWNDYGAIGNEAAVEPNRAIRPMKVQAPEGQEGYLTDVVTAACGGSTNLALRSDGTVWNWGYNYTVERNLGTSYDEQVTQQRPIQVVDTDGSSFMSDIIDVGAGDYHLLAARRDGQVYGWGYNATGALGFETDPMAQDYNIPTLIPDFTDVVKVEGGAMFSLAIKSDGTVWSWGQNDSGQLGDGTTDLHTAPAPTAPF
jgi:alpha-tubulin suppressor-like RCC1 family protein